MGLISKKGKDVLAEVNKEDIDLKKVYIRLKDGDSVRVRLLSADDYVQYRAHSNGFSFGIYTQPCTAPAGEECPLCKAYESNKEEYKDLRPSNRYLIAMADLDEGAIRVWDASKSQLKGLISQIEEYREMIEDPDEEIMFTFKRTGTKTSTTYTLAPIMNKKVKADLSESYHKFDGVTVEDNFFESVLVPRPKDLIVKTLKQAGLDTDTLFPDVIITDDATEIDGDIQF